MRTSWRIFRMAGVDVRVHVTFVLLALWLALSGLSAGRPGGRILGELALAAGVFLLVLLHEFGHALMARRFGIRTLHITLLPIGGIARLARMPDRPFEEFLVALAGPMVNLGLGGALVGVSWVMEGAPTLPSRPDGSASWLLQGAAVNFSLGLFNLIPAFPMDGGRILRAALSARMSQLQATWWAARVGQALAALLGGVGLVANPMLALLALFVWSGAEAELAAARLKDAFLGIDVGRAMLTDFRVVRREDALPFVAGRMLAAAQPEFPVVDDRGRLVGWLTREDILGGLHRGAGTRRVGDVLRSGFLTTHPAEPVDSLLARLAGTGQRCVPVVEGNSVLGLFMPEHLTEVVRLQSALEAASDPGARLAAARDQGRT